VSAQVKRKRAEFGDFQTPEALARQICSLLATKGVVPSSLIEPTCGAGVFLRAALDQFPSIQKAIGLDINKHYVERVEANVSETPYKEKTRVILADFFRTQWSQLLENSPDPLLVLGNPPWVTSATLGSFGSQNLPAKSNFQNHRGMDAITGKANFDISEWMMLRILDWLNGRDGVLALLCKTAVARKVLRRAWEHSLHLDGADIYKVDALAHFGASVDACLLVCTFQPNKSNFDCAVFSDVTAATPSSAFGYRSGKLIADIRLYERWRHLEGAEIYKWRSGIKHDCSPVLELDKDEQYYVNGLAERVELEDTYLFPMLKSSDVANNNVANPTRRMLVTQHRVGEKTDSICKAAPQTWRYLQRHASLLGRRASSIYKNRPAFSIFGVGEYSFSPWKVAISGFYKRLAFTTVGPSANKPVVLDDTSYFIPCRTEEEALFVAALLNSEPAGEFYRAFVFWDAKRPITVDLLRRLDLLALARELGSEELLKQFLPEHPINHQSALMGFESEGRKL